jgi:hypothetical protein
MTMVTPATTTRSQGKETTPTPATMNDTNPREDDNANCPDARAKDTRAREFDPCRVRGIEERVKVANEGGKRLRTRRRKRGKKWE